MERALAAQGVTVETATTDDAGPGLHNGNPCGQPLRENDCVHRYFTKTTEVYKTSFHFARWIADHAANYDLLHIHALFSFTTSTAVWAARKAGVPYVIRPLGTLNSYGLQHRRAWAKRLSVKLIEGPALRDASAVHFTSVAEAVEARRLGIHMREAIIPLAVEPPGAAANRRAISREIGPRLLFLSRLDPKKNVEGLLSAMALLKKEVPALRLVIAGDGSAAYVSGLKAQAASLQLEQQVTWLGHVEGEHKIAAFAAADIFVLPSYSENFGIAAAEALAAGLPCVLGEGVAIAKDVMEANAGITVTAEPASIAEGLRRIIADHESRTGMSANASRLAHERYSAKAMGKGLKRLYEQILAR
jgi:glycosyltransferase involved in cell wall biosynthesis